MTLRDSFKFVMTNNGVVPYQIIRYYVRGIRFAEAKEPSIVGGILGSLGFQNHHVLLSTRLSCSRASMRGIVCNPGMCYMATDN